jgi:transcriptional regulator with XRE-family HTH domain
MTGLAQILRDARLSAGLTQRQVADALAVPHTYPSRWERGASRPGPANLLALADVYGLDPATLLRLYAGDPPRAAGKLPPAADEAGKLPPAADEAGAAAALGRALVDAAAGKPARRRRRAATDGSGRRPT